MVAFLVSLAYCLIMNPWPNLQSSKHSIVHMNVLLVFKLHIVNINSTTPLELA
jgi:hypothetical protein